MRIHWVTFVIYKDVETVNLLYNRFFGARLGELSSENRGGRGYRDRLKSGGGAVLYYLPQQLTKEGLEHCCLDLSGSVCDCLLPTDIQDFYLELECLGLEFKITRIDIAYDNCPFTPLELYFEALAGRVRSLFKRETLSIIQSPFEKKENGEIGTCSVYIGSGTSERFLRVYDRRGYTRCELVCKGFRALAVSNKIFHLEYQDWDKEAISHLRDYADFEFPSWLEFCAGVERAYLVISAARIITVNRLKEWMYKQVSKALYVLSEVEGENFLEGLAYLGLQKFQLDQSRYKHIMELCYPPSAVLV